MNWSVERRRLGHFPETVHKLTQDITRELDKIFSHGTLVRYEDKRGDGGWLYYLDGQPLLFYTDIPSALRRKVVAPRVEITRRQLRAFRREYGT